MLYVPESHNTEPMPRTNTVVTIEPGKSGAAIIFVNGHLVAEERLSIQFARYAEHSSHDVLVEADSDASYGAVAEVGDAALRSGFTGVWVANRAWGTPLGTGPTAAFKLALLRDPSTSKSPTSLIDDRREVTIDVFEGGKFSVDGRAVAYADLQRAVRSAFNFHRTHTTTLSTRVLLAGVPRSRWDSIIAAKDAAHQAGDDDVRWILYTTDDDVKKGLDQMVGPCSGSCWPGLT